MKIFKHILVASLAFTLTIGCIIKLLPVMQVEAHCGSMGDPDSVANAANAAWDAAIASGASCAEASAIADAAAAAALGATGVKGDFDGDGIPDNQQSKSTSKKTTASPKATQKTDNTAPKAEAKTETTANETAEPKPVPEPEPVHEHNYRKEITKMPTCTEPGIETYTCDCGDSYTEEIPAKGHDEGEWSTVVEPTCTTEGKKVLKCTTCGEELKEEIIPALGHTPGDWKITKQADWIHDGEQVKKCTVCEEVLETQVIPANHTPLYIIGGGAVFLILIGVVIIRRRK